ncbi:MAG: hypothetical protein ACI9U2_003697, partial [Bradymonadia bacterium]
MRALLVSLLVLVPTFAAALPNEFTQEGLLIDAQGRALEGAHAITARIYAADVGGQPAFEERHPVVTLFDGYYAIAIGSRIALDPTLFNQPALWLAIAIDDGDELTPRTALRKVPAAMVADVALTVVGDINPSSVSVDDRLVINGDGEWVGPAAELQGP